MSDFLQELIFNFSNHFKNSTTYNRAKYPNQDEISCQFLYDSCVKFDPDYVIDIGTNFGASALSLAYGLSTLGHDLNTLTTIDLSHDHWTKRTPDIQGGLLSKYDMDMKRIQAVCGDFRSLDPAEFIKKDARYLIFYDIHDTIDFSFSQKFLDKWVPLVKEGFIGIHDMSFCSSSYEIKQGPDPRYPRTMGVHFSGKNFSGFKECETIVEWLNLKRIDVQYVPKTSVIWFKV